MLMRCNKSLCDVGKDFKAYNIIHFRCCNRSDSNYKQDFKEIAFYYFPKGFLYSPNSCFVK